MNHELYDRYKRILEELEYKGSKDIAISIMTRLHNTYLTRRQLARYLDMWEFSTVDKSLTNLIKQGFVVKEKNEVIKKYQYSVHPRLLTMYKLSPPIKLVQ